MLPSRRRCWAGSSWASCSGARPGAFGHLQIAGAARARSFVRHPTSLVHWGKDRPRMSVLAMTYERKPSSSHVLPRTHGPQTDAAPG